MDLGCGKAYFAFLLNELLCQKIGRGKIIGVEFREDLITTCQKLAQQMNYSNMTFQHSKIEDSKAEKL